MNSDIVELSAKFLTCCAVGTSLYFGIQHIKKNISFY